MALYTRSEYAEFLGISRGNVTTYISRGKIFVDPKTDKIDSLHPQNNDFQKQREAIKLQKSIDSVSTVNDSPTKKSISSKPQSQTTTKTDKKEVVSGESVKSKYLLDLKKVEVEIEKKEIDILIAEQRLSTLRGSNVPMDVVDEVLSKFSRDTLHGYDAFFKQKFSDFCHKYKVSPVERTKMLTKHTEEINKTHSRIIKETKISLKNLIGASKLTQSESTENED